MNIGIKYCGGCNPRYDRSDFINRLKKDLGEGHEFQVARKDNVFDTILVLCGCTSACADYSELKAIQDKIIITEKEEYERVLKKLL